MTRYCTVERDGAVTIVTIRRPEVMNALHPDAHDELQAVWDDFAYDDTQWVGILTGAGDRAFCTGNDLKASAAQSGRGVLPRTGFAGLTARFDNDKPIIAAVNGAAVGGGFETVLACDIAIADEHARFGFPEPSLGRVAGAGGMHRLPRTIGLKRSMGMLLTGKLVGAHEGYEMGFITEVVGKGAALARARAMAAQMLELSPMALRATKQVVMGGLGIADLAQACNTDFPAWRALRESADFLEGPLAFAEKRRPVWQNAGPRGGATS